MNPEEAKKILALYRPDSEDKNDTAFVAALDEARRDPELGKWFGEHCASHLAVRRVFRQVSIPAGLKEQILAERKIHALPMAPRRAPRLLLAMAAAVAAVLGIMSFHWNRAGGALDSVPAFQRQMARTALRLYGMDLETTNLDRIRAFFAERNAPAGYVLPRNIDKAQAIGCAALTWDGKPVSMLCFRSGKATRPGQMSDLWLFVIDANAVPGPRLGAAPAFGKINRLTTATWSDGQRAYILAADGDRSFLEQFL